MDSFIFLSLIFLPCVRSLAKPTCVVRLPFVEFRMCADDDGLGFLAMQEPANNFPAIQFGSAFNLGNARSHHGSAVNILGLVMAVLPRSIDERCYIVSPHVALVIPYSLLIVGAGGLLIVRTPAAKWIASSGRWSPASTWTAGGVVLLFAILNTIPSASRPGAAIHPQTIYEWITLIFEPQTAYSELTLIFGFPFSCFKKVILSENMANSLLGTGIGWEPHKAAENICIAAVVAIGAGLASQWVLQSTRLRSKRRQPA